MIYPSNPSNPTNAGQICHFCGIPFPPGATACATCGARPGTGSGAGCALAGGLTVLGLFLIAMISGIVILVLRARNERAHAWPSTPTVRVPGPPSPVSPGPSRARESGIVSWVGNPTGEICLADANGDGTPDVIGYGTSLLAIDGRTGATLWNTGEEGHEKLWCDGHGKIVRVHAADFSFSAIDPRSGTSLWTSKLDDTIESVVFGDGCVAVHATDGKYRELDATTGAARACAVKKPAKHAHHDGSKARAAGVEVEAGASKGAGTPRLQVRASGGATWETTISTIDADSHQSVTASKHGVYVAGKKHGGAGMMVVRLDLHSGAILATHEESHVTKPDAFFLKSKATDHLVFVESFGMIHAYEPEKLSRTWWAGTMWADR